MATGQIKVTTIVEITEPTGRKLKPLVFRSTHTGLTALENRDFAITADQTRTIWDPTVEATENPATFAFLLMCADGTLDVEQTVNEGDANERLQTMRLYNGLPLMLGADDAFYGATAGLGGTLDVIDKIRVDEPASAARKLKLIMGA